MILDRKAQNGNLKKDMSKVNIIDPKGNKLVVVFGSYWNDMKDFYINVFGNDEGFKYIIRKSNIDTRSILNDYLKARKNSQKTDTRRQMPKGKRQVSINICHCHNPLSRPGICPRRTRKRQTARTSKFARTR